MGRFSPTVLEQPFNLSGILDQLLQGYDAGRQGKKEALSRKRREKFEDEDRARRERQERAKALGRPGASTLGVHFDDPNAIPLTQETLRTVGRADTNRVPLEFERPEARSLASFIPDYVPGANLPSPESVPEQEPGAKPGEYMFQDRAPHMIAPGVVMDPGRARKERTFATILEEQLRQSLAGPQPWKPTTREEQIEFTRDTSTAGRAPETRRNIDPLSELGIERAGQRATETRAPTEPEPPKSIGLLNREIADADFELSRLSSIKPPTPTKDSDSVVRGAYNDWQSRYGAVEASKDSLNTLRGRISRDYMIEQGVLSPERPTPQGTRGVPYRRGAGPLREFENTGAESPDLFTRVRGAQPPRLDVTRPLPADTATVPAETPPDSVPAPSEAGGEAPADLAGRARALRQEHPDWTREQAIAELRRQDEAARRGQ